MKLAIFPIVALLAAFAAPAFAGISLATPAENVRVPLLSEFKRMYFTLPAAERRAKFADSGFRQKMRADGWKPEPVRFAWTGGKGPFDVVISRADGQPFCATNLTDRTFSCAGFELATRYVWTVTDRVGETAKGCFETDSLAPRLIDGGTIPNMRDLGGRIGLGGRRVRQGRVFRSAALNENAKPVIAIEPSALSSAEDATRRAVADDLAAARERCRAAADGSAAVKIARFGLGPDWSVCKFAGNFQQGRVLSALRAVTLPSDPIAGVSPVAVRASDDGFVRFFEHGTGTAFLVQTLVSSEDCAIPLVVAGDWYWAVAVNGRVVRDYILDGNVTGPVTVPDHRLLLPLRKGANLVAVAVLPGRSGWSWVSRPDLETPVSEFLAKELVELDAQCAAAVRWENGFVPGATRVTDETRARWIDDFGIRTDIDLRRDRETVGMTGSPLGPAVRWVNVPNASYVRFAAPWAREQFAKVFRVFLDPARHPIDFHCISGQDRTGSVAFLLNAILGVDPDELAKDWEATGFWNDDMTFIHALRYDTLLPVFESCPGSTFLERIENYVRSCGITDDEIAAFRELMLEPPR